MNAKVEPTVSVLERRPGDVVSVAVLWLLWALSVVPLVVLFLEFGEPSPVCVGASYYAKLYGHIFVYPATFGFFATIFLTQPWLHTVRSIRNLPSPRRSHVTAFLAFCIMGIVAFASWADFTKAAPALWSFGAAAKEEIGNQDIRDACRTLMERCQECESTAAETTEGEGAETPQREGEHLPAHGRGRQVPKHGEQEAKALDPLQKLRSDNDRSYTEWAYYVGFIANTMWIALLFGVVVDQTGADDRSQLGKTIVAMGLATAWVPFRIAFLSEKVELYSSDPLQGLNYLIFLAFVVLYLHALRWHMSGPGGKRRNAVPLTGHVIVVILTCSSAVVGLLADVGLLDRDGTKLLVRYFGSESSLLVYITMLLLFLVMVAPAIVRRLRGNSGP